MYINPKRWIRGKIKKLTMAAINFTHLGNENLMISKQKWGNHKKEG